MAVKDPETWLLESTGEARHLFKDASCMNMTHGMKRSFEKRVLVKQIREGIM